MLFIYILLIFFPIQICFDNTAFTRSIRTRKRNILYLWIVQRPLQGI
ncbi:hypothetical protein DXA55_05115 [Blautia sp. OF03-13]|nr:hypothetical protein DXA55_05115 [Blautia sp. OF03-13]